MPNGYDNNQKLLVPHFVKNAVVARAVRHETRQFLSESFAERQILRDLFDRFFQLSPDRRPQS